ncbi:MAG: hypothetical protein HQL24_00185 [Candidatus Omnitrophica bacterium]|nr:hypothetical protein [Candidatus Omnitrophota bacterium]
MINRQNEFLMFLKKDKKLQASTLILIVAFCAQMVLLGIDKKQSLEIQKLQQSLEKKKAALRLMQVRPNSPGVSKTSALAVEDPGLPSLSGIVFSKEMPRAIIDNKIVVVGDKVKSNKVVKITENTVVLNDGTKDFTLFLK